jgi:putative CocE/NonD family hydrolase
MRICRMFSLASLLLLLALPSLAQTDHPVTLERDVKVKMRDGVKLAADIYRPTGSEKYPVLLQRTPYNKDVQADLAIKAATRGYVVIIQDVRGRYASEGDWYPFKYESQDGYDTVEWAAALPYSSGKVGMFGESYVGATQVLAAIAHPPHLAAIAPSDTASNYHSNWTYQGGALQQGFDQSWTSGLAIETLSRYLPKIANSPESSHTLPLSHYPLLNFNALPPEKDWTAKYAPYLLDWMAHPSFDAYWKRWSIEDHYSDIQVPALIITAWYDIFQSGSLRNYRGFRNEIGNVAARKNQSLVIAIGGHAGSGRKIGDLDFGQAAADYNEDDTVLSWYDFQFKGIQNQWATSKPVKIFVMGTNAWRDEDEWPLSRAKEVKYFLHSGGQANSSSGNGTLAQGVPHVEQPDQYTYDPQNPVPTVGGPLCCDGVHLPGGPKDQRSVEQRKDVLIYSAKPFAHDTEITGPVAVELYVKSTAVDTDFTAKLVDLWPNGYAQNLTEGILRARYRESQSKPSLLVPGDIYKIRVDLGATGNVFLAGHTLRLEISSSNFPRFDRNLNTGADQASTSHSTAATNTILHDDEHPSVLILPIALPGGSDSQSLNHGDAK